MSRVRNPEVSAVKFRRNEARCCVEPRRAFWLAALLTGPVIFAALLVEIVVPGHQSPRGAVIPIGVGLAVAGAADALIWHRLRHRTVWRALANADGLRLDGGPMIPWASVRRAAERAQTQAEEMELPLDELGVRLEVNLQAVTRGSRYLDYLDATGVPGHERIPSHHRGYLGFRLFLRRMLAEHVELQLRQG